MTKEEFIELDYKDILTNDRYPDENYEIYDTDVFGVGDTVCTYKVRFVNRCEDAGLPYGYDRTV